MKISEQGLELIRKYEQGPLVTVDAEAAVNKMVSTPLLQREFDALVALVFNIGGNNFFSSTLRKKVNRMDYASAAEEFHRWNMVGGIKLIARRADERKLFLTGSY